MPSAELTPIEVWSLILEESRNVINPQTFKTWLEPTEAVALADNRLLVNVKNQFAVDYIEGQYGAVLSRIAGSLFDADLTISFRSDSREQPEAIGTRPILASDTAAESRPAPERPAPAGPVNQGMPLNPRYTFETFVVGNSNQWAHAASQSVANWAYIRPRAGHQVPTGSGPPLQEPAE